MSVTTTAMPAMANIPRARQIFFSLLGTVAVTLMGLGIVAPLMPVFAKDLGASGVWLGLMLAAFSISRGVIQPIVGVMSDRYGRKRFIVTGLAIYASISFVYI
ncbi:MAG: MFS transporter, partial [Dehalococcoidia bacterium]